MFDPGDLVEEKHTDNKAGDSGDSGDYYIVGRVTSANEDGTITFVEGHAIHIWWGGSNNCRGRVHTSPTSAVAPCRPEWRHMARLAPKQTLTSIPTST